MFVRHIEQRAIGCEKQTNKQKSIVNSQRTQALTNWRDNKNSQSPPMTHTEQQFEDLLRGRRPHASHCCAQIILCFFTVFFVCEMRIFSPRHNVRFFFFFFFLHKRSWLITKESVYRRNARMCSNRTLSAKKKKKKKKKNSNSSSFISILKQHISLDTCALGFAPLASNRDTCIDESNIYWCRQTTHPTSRSRSASPREVGFVCTSSVRCRPTA
jgi:hypothetical protein